MLANFSAEPVPAEVPDAAGWDGAELVLGNLADPPGRPGSDPLRPWEARILRRRVSSP